MSLVTQKYYAQYQDLTKRATALSGTLSGKLDSVTTLFASAPELLPEEMDGALASLQGISVSLPPFLGGCEISIMSALMPGLGSYMTALQQSVAPLSAYPAAVIGPVVESAEKALGGAIDAILGNLPVGQVVQALSSLESFLNLSGVVGLIKSLKNLNFSLNLCGTLAGALPGGIEDTLSNQFGLDANGRLDPTLIPDLQIPGKEGVLSQVSALKAQKDGLVKSFKDMKDMLPPLDEIMPEMPEWPQLPKIPTIPTLPSPPPLSTLFSA